MKLPVEGGSRTFTEVNLGTFTVSCSFSNLHSFKTPSPIFVFSVHLQHQDEWTDSHSTSTGDGQTIDNRPIVAAPPPSQLSPQSRSVARLRVSTLANFGVAIDN